MNTLKSLWRNLRTSFWFVPSLIIGAGIALAVALIEVDSTRNGQWLAHWPRLFGASAAGARVMLSTIAGSMMTVVGVTFSMTLVTLALASSQYTSRILRNFIGDRITQVVLGIFAGIFAYCLIVLRTIRSGDAGGFVPSLAVFFAVVLAMGGIGVLKKRIDEEQDQIGALELDRAAIAAQESQWARRHLLLTEKNHVIDSFRQGVLNQEVYEKLLADIDVRLLRLVSGEEEKTTVEQNSAKKSTLQQRRS